MLGTAESFHDPVPGSPEVLLPGSTSCCDPLRALEGWPGYTSCLGKSRFSTRASSSLLAQRPAHRSFYLTTAVHALASKSEEAWSPTGEMTVLGIPRVKDTVLMESYFGHRLQVSFFPRALLSYDCM